jgi:hypothetical protein
MTACRHTRTGVVTSLAEWSGGKHAQAPVCDDLECIADAKEWVTRVSGKPARHVLDEVVKL